MGELRLLVRDCHPNESERRIGKGASASPEKRESRGLDDEGGQRKSPPEVTPDGINQGDKKRDEQDRLEFRVLGKGEPTESGQLSWENSSKSGD